MISNAGNLPVVRPVLNQLSRMSRNQIMIVEVLNAVPVHTKDFNWNSTFNIAYNSSDDENTRE